MFRHLVISNSCNIKVKDNNLIVKQDKEYKVPIEDISTIVIESRESVISTYALSKINDNNILLLICDEKHLINGQMHSIHSNYKSSSVLKYQISMSKPTKNNLWKNIITQKIYNQSLCLEKLNMKESYKLKEISKSVKSNDKTNREAYGASIYFKNLFEKKFTRRCDNIVNSALNYGYSIVRSNISRYCGLYGLNTELGIFHDSQLNNFNLVDDLIEPIRPFVDLYIMKIINKYDEFSVAFKHDIININNYEMILDNKNYCLDSVIDLYVRSFKASIINDNFELIKIPTIKDIMLHNYE